GRLEGLQVRPGGYFRHDPAEAGMLIHRRGGDVDEQVQTAGQGNAGLVTGGLDTQNQGSAHCPSVRGRAGAQWPACSSPVATGRSASSDPCDHEPGYRAASMPMEFSAATSWAAVTPDPQ